MNRYEHTQKGPLGVILLVAAVANAVCAALFRDQPAAAATFGVVAVVLLLVAGLFGRLTVTADEFGLRLQYGPLPLIAKSFSYESMRSVEAAKSRFIDGWGIHFVPFRGWTYNLWGFDCVLIQRRGANCLRIGTDDVPGLLAFLQSRVEASPKR